MSALWPTVATKHFQHIPFQFQGVINNILLTLSNYGYVAISKYNSIAAYPEWNPGPVSFFSHEDSLLDSTG